MRRKHYPSEDRRTLVFASLMLVACVFSFVRPSVAQEAAADEKVEAKQEAAAQARAHYSKGQTLEAAGDADGAADEYLQALRKDPSAIGNNVYRLVQVVHRTKRVDELVRALEETDVAAFGQYYYVSNLYQYLMNYDEHHDASLKIFGLAWKAFPANHLQLLQMVHHEKIWQRPEMFDYAREALIPNREQVATNPWIGMIRIMSYDAQGKANGIVTRLVVAAAARNKLDDLAAQLASLLEQQPEWYGGQAISAVLDVKQGNIDNARERIVKLLDIKSAPMPVSARWLLSQELDGVDAMDDLSLRLMEDAREELFQSQSQFSYSAARRLVQLYAREGRKQDGRALIHEFLDKQDFTAISRNNPGYGEYQEIENVNGTGSELLALGFPLDAARLYRKALADKDKLERAKRWNNNSDYLLRRLEAGLRAAENGITPDALAASLRESIHAEAGDDSPSVELGLSVRSDDVTQATLQSEFQAAILATTESPEGVEAADQTAKDLARLIEQRPNDLSVHIADFLIARATGDVERGSQSLQRVAEFVASHPLDEQASDQFAIWIVAREALGDKESYAAGVKLAERAVAAARRQPDAKWPLGILREWGQIELAAGNRQAAEQRWTQMLEQILKP